MTTEPRVLVRYEGQVALVELNRPHVMNALDADSREELAAAIHRVACDQGVRAVVLTGVGRAFCSGADLQTASERIDEQSGPRTVTRALLMTYAPLVESITRMEKPVIAAVNGAAAGIGMALALACDLLIMAREASMIPSFTTFGLIPDGGSSWFLTRKLGGWRAFEVLAEGRHLPAVECHALGIVNRVVEGRELREQALSWAQGLAARAPLALALTKRLVRLSAAGHLSDVLSVEAELQSICFSSADVAEGVAAHKAKRAPRFEGR